MLDEDAEHVRTTEGPHRDRAVARRADEELRATVPRVADEGFCVHLMVQDGTKHFDVLNAQLAVHAARDDHA